MKIKKDTQVCISIAKRPGNFGATVFNAAFESLGLNFIYKPFQVDEEKLQDAIRGVRALGIRGCAVTMPHKTTVIQYIDELDPMAKKIGAVNTIVNTDGILKGYNTDYLGAKQVIAEKFKLAGKKVLIVGAGGVARAIIVALQELSPSEILLTNRDEKKGKQLAEEFGVRFVPMVARGKELECNLLINATSVGMAPSDGEMMMTEEELSRFEAVMDVVTIPQETKLLKAAQKLGKILIPGYEMTLRGAAVQFELYTGKSAPLEVMRLKASIAA